MSFKNNEWTNEEQKSSSSSKTFIDKQTVSNSISQSKDNQLSYSEDHKIVSDEEEEKHENLGLDNENSLINDNGSRMSNCEDEKSNESSLGDEIYGE